MRLDQKQFQFLFTDGDDYTFMDNETYDQVAVHLDFIGEDAVRFLQEGMNVEMEFYEESPIGVTLPEKVTLEITEADAVVKGQPHRRPINRPCSKMASKRLFHRISKRWHRREHS